MKAKHYKLPFGLYMHVYGSKYKGNKLSISYSKHAGELNIHYDGRRIIITTLPF